MAACGVALVFVVAAVRRGRGASSSRVSPVLVGLADPQSLRPVAGAARRRRRSRRCSRERHRLGWALLGAAVAAKLWPLVLVPLALVVVGPPRARLGGARRRRGRRGRCSCRSSCCPRTACGRACSGQAVAPAADREPRRGALHHLRPPAGDLVARLAEHRGARRRRGRVRPRPGEPLLLALWVAFARGPATRDRFLRYAAASVCAFIALRQGAVAPVPALARAARAARARPPRRGGDEPADARASS